MQGLWIKVVTRKRIELVEPAVVLVVVPGAQIVLLQSGIELLATVEQRREWRVER
jgi:hypothetical protein